MSDKKYKYSFNISHKSFSGDIDFKSVITVESSDILEAVVDCAKQLFKDSADMNLRLNRCVKEMKRCYDSITERAYVFNEEFPEFQIVSVVSGDMEYEIKYGFTKSRNKFRFDTDDGNSLGVYAPTDVYALYKYVWMYVAHKPEYVNWIAENYSANFGNDGETTLDSFPSHLKDIYAEFPNLPKITQIIYDNWVIYRGEERNDL